MLSKFWRDGLGRGFGSGSVAGFGSVTGRGAEFLLGAMDGLGLGRGSRIRAWGQV